MSHPLATSPGRVVLAGDWHGDLEHARSVIGWAKQQGAQGIVHLGDFGVWHGAAGRRYLDGVALALKGDAVWLAFVDGNHEWFEWLNSVKIDDYGARRLRGGLFHLPRGLRWTWHGKRWLALGGATSLDRPSRRLGIDWWPEESITEQQARMAADGGRADVMLTHDCPAGVDIPDLPPASYWPAAELVRANAHRELLRSVVDEVQPERLYHGHFHIRYDDVLRTDDYKTAVTGLNDNNGPWHQNVLLLDLEAA